MTYDEAVRTREQQLQGQTVEPASLSQALSVIRTQRPPPAAKAPKAPKAKRPPKPEPKRADPNSPYMLVRSRFPQVANPWRLSCTQAAVIQRIALGDSTAQAGEALGMNQSTAMTHLRRAKVKMDARNTAHAVSLWVQATAKQGPTA